MGYTVCMREMDAHLEPLMSEYLRALTESVRSHWSEGLRVVADDVLMMERELGLDHALYAAGLGVFHQPFVCPVVDVFETVGGHMHGFVVSDGAWVRPLLALERHCLDGARKFDHARRQLHEHLFGCYRWGRETPVGDFERGERLLWVRLNGAINRVCVWSVTMSRALPETEQSYYEDVSYPVATVIVPSHVLRKWLGVRDGSDGV